MPAPDPVTAAQASTLGHMADLMRVPRLHLPSICVIAAADALARGQFGLAAGMTAVAEALAAKEARP